jgi:hypothetical protein
MRRTATTLAGRGIALAASCTAVPAATAAPSAQGGTGAAAVRPSSVTFAVPAGATVSKGFGPSRVSVTAAPGALPRTTINCTLTAYTPILESGTLAYEHADVNCTALVTSLSVSVSAAVNGQAYLVGSHTVSGLSYDNAQGTVNCLAGQAVQTVGNGSVTFPAGITPSSGTFTPTISSPVTCTG